MTKEKDEIATPDQPAAPGSGFDSWAAILAPDDQDDGLKNDLNGPDQLPLF